MAHGVVHQTKLKQQTTVSSFKKRGCITKSIKIQSESCHQTEQNIKITAQNIKRRLKLHSKYKRRHSDCKQTPKMKSRSPLKLFI